MAQPLDRVQETAAAPGTGAVTLAGAVTGYRTFASAYGAAADKLMVCLVSQTPGDWEIAECTLSGSTALTRGAIVASSNSGNRVNFAGAVYAFVTAPGPYMQDVGQVFAAGISDYGLF